MDEAQRLPTHDKTIVVIAYNASMAKDFAKLLDLDYIYVSRFDQLRDIENAIIYRLPGWWRTKTFSNQKRILDYLALLARDKNCTNISQF